MKSVLSSLLLLFASQAWACPQLAGSYICQNSDGDRYEQVITQSMRGGATVYVIDSEMEVIADGRSYPVNEQDFVGTYTATCGGTHQVTVRLSGTTDFGDGTFGKVDIAAILSATSRGFDTKTTGIIDYQGQQHPIEGTESCVRR